MSDLESRHLAELHARAAEHGIPRYRLMRRDELVGELRARGATAPEADAGVAEEAPPDEPGRREPAERRRDEEHAERVTGVLDVMPQRFGFLRLEGLGPEDGDVYISASQIRRCELRPGDVVSGPAREPRRGERHRALVRVEEVNGVEPGAGRRTFDELTPVPPHRRLVLEPAEDALLLRAVDLLTPLGFGQRVLISAAPRSGRTTLLRALAKAVARAEAAELTVLLVDERPEEATRWREAVTDEQLAIATADATPAEQGRIAELALARARRQAESGADAVLLVDSLSRLAAARDPATVKRLFGSGRELGEEQAGSLTVIATVLADGDDPAAQAVATTENALIRLDPGLAAAGIFPALDPGRCSVANEEELRDPEELDAARRLRGLLADLALAEAARMLRERIEGTATNRELLAMVAGSVPPDSR